MVAQNLRIAEVFQSIQGEGIWAGIPSLFVRVSGCNMRCRWCDTPYASWNPEGDIVELSEISRQIEASPLRHVVLTGGEPMMFDLVVELATSIKSIGKTLTIETAGTVFRELPCDLMSISPKLSNSTPDAESGWKDRHDRVRLNREPLAALIERYSCQLKFVIGDNIDEDLGEIDGILETLPGFPSDRILLMAEGICPQTIHDRMVKLVPVAMNRNWRLTPRLHVDLFGNTRGT